MKTWIEPEIIELDITCTEQGKDLSVTFDEIRIDQNGNYWAGFGSGLDSNPDTDGFITVN